MDISCVIPAFERTDLLARCLASATAQRDVEMEVIVTDDSVGRSNRDFMVGMAEAFPSVRYLEGARTGNAVDNWNHGLTRARAPACVLIHHDEHLIDPNYLRRALDRLWEPGVAAVIGPTAVTGVTRPSRFALAARFGCALGRPTWILPSLNWIGPTAAFVFRRGPLFDPSLVQLVDVDFYRRVLGKGRAAMLEGDCVGSLGHHDAQITASIDPRQTARREIARLAGGPELSFHRAVLGLRRWAG